MAFNSHEMDHRSHRTSGENSAHPFQIRVEETKKQIITFDTNRVGGGD